MAPQGSSSNFAFLSDFPDLPFGFPFPPFSFSFSGFGFASAFAFSEGFGLSPSELSLLAREALDDEGDDGDNEAVGEFERLAYVGRSLGPKTLPDMPPMSTVTSQLCP